MRGSAVRLCCCAGSLATVMHTAATLLGCDIANNSNVLDMLYPLSKRGNVCGERWWNGRKSELAIAIEISGYVSNVVGNLLNLSPRL